MHPVKRAVGTDRDALLDFIDEAASHGYAMVFVATDVADALGAPFSAPIPVVHERFVPDGLALAMPEPVLDFTLTTPTPPAAPGEKLPGHERECLCALCEDPEVPDAR